MTTERPDEEGMIFEIDPRAQGSIRLTGDTQEPVARFFSTTFGANRAQVACEALNALYIINPSNPLAAAKEIGAMATALERGAKYLEDLYDNMLANDADMLIDKSESPRVVADEFREILARIKGERG